MNSSQSIFIPAGFSTPIQEEEGRQFSEMEGDLNFTAFSPTFLQLCQ